VIPIDDPADPRVADYLTLSDPSRRRAGTFLAEGRTVVERAIDAGFGIRSMLVSEGREATVPAGAGAVPAYSGPVYRVSPEVARRIAGFDIHRGVIAVVDRPPEYSLAGVAAGARRLLVVEGVTDTENLGSLFRSAAALGADGVVVDATSADPLYRRVVRVSMGASFLLPWARAAAGAWPPALPGWTTVALTPAGEVDLGEVDRGTAVAPLAASNQLAVLVGAEGRGLAAATLAAATHRARIPMAAGLDSLNVAVAAAVALWALRRR
jgi:tRNA G18 (ribose-2'-O)-methylase SpoU